MGQFFLIVVVALTVAAVVFGVTVLVSGSDTGLTPAEPDGRAVPLPASRPLQEDDLGVVKFDTAVRGYRMGQVDQALRRAAYDIGYKDELIGVLEAEVTALREGRTLDADALRRAREAAQQPTAVATLPPPDAPDEADVVVAQPAPAPIFAPATVTPAEPSPAAPVAVEPAEPVTVDPVFADPIVDQAGPAPAAPEPSSSEPSSSEPEPKDEPGTAGESEAATAVEAVDEKGDSSRA
jgi:DivIVA domain-containing protein